MEYREHSPPYIFIHLHLHQSYSILLFDTPGRLHMRGPILGVQTTVASCYGVRGIRSIRLLHALAPLSHQRQNPVDPFYCLDSGVPVSP